MSYGIDKPDCVFCGRAVTGEDPDGPAVFPPVCADCEGRRQSRIVAEAVPERPRYLTDGSPGRK